MNKLDPLNIFKNVKSFIYRSLIFLIIKRNKNIKQKKIKNKNLNVVNDSII